MDKRALIALAEYKRQTKESFYILLDGSCESNAIRHLFAYEGVDAYHFLYLGTPYTSVMEYGPVLAAVSTPSPFLSWFWEEGPTVHAGIALFSPLSLAALAGQLRDILTVTLPEGPKALFRFYDPRLARAAVKLTVKNGSMALTKDISALYSPRYTFGHAPIWEQVAATEQNHG
jgi:hypothetical protein